MKPKEKLTKELQDEIKRLAEIQKTVDAIPVNQISEIFPQGRWYKNWSDIVFGLPMSFPLIEEFKEMMSSQFPEFEMYKEYQFVWDDQARAGKFLYYKKSDYIEFEVAFRSETVGSTCVLNPIGKEMKEVITYEVVCSQEAANEF
jgi:hypothetical protein